MVEEKSDRKMQPSGRPSAKGTVVSLLLFCGPLLLILTGPSEPAADSANNTSELLAESTVFTLNL